MRINEKSRMKYLVVLGVIVMLSIFMLAKPSKVSAAEVLNVSNGAEISSEFQDALDKAKTDGSVEITIPNGTFYLSKCLHIYSNTTINASSKTTIIRKNMDGTLMRFGSITDTNTGYDGYHDITINGGTWDSNGDSNNILRFAHAKNVNISNATFKNAKDSHLIELAACIDVKFTNCTFSNLTCTCKSTTNHEALQLDIMQKSHFDNFPKEDETPCKNITVEKCTFDNVQRGVGSHSAIIGSYFTNIKIINNTFKNIPGYAIIATNYRNSTINNNTITNCGTGIIFRTANPAGKAFYAPAYTQNVKIESKMNTTIKGNKITIKYTNYSELAKGISLYGANITKATSQAPIKGNYTLRGVTVTNNTVTLPCKGLAICLEGSNENKVTNNIVTCNITSKGNGSGTGDGIRLTNSDKNELTGNKITNQKWTGNASQMNGISIIQGSDSNTLSGNTITNASVHGITIQDSKNNIVKSKNIIKTTKTTNGNGIYVCKSNGTQISSNEVSNTKSHGIQVKSSTNVSVKSNKVNKTTGSNGVGIVIQSASNNAQVSKNNITNAKRDGIYVTEKSKNVKVTSNTIKSSGRNGIYLYKADGAQLSSNTVSGTKGHAIQVKSSAKVSVKSNKINKTTGSNSVGIIIQSTSNSAQVSKNTITNVKRDGIYVADKSKNVKVTSNTIKSCGRNGIYLYKANGTQISSNKVSNTKNHGIQVNSSTKVSVKSNKISKATGSNSVGIIIQSASNSAQVSKNNITDAKRDGICVTDKSKNVKVNSNTIKNCGRIGLFATKKSTVTQSGNKISKCKSQKMRSTEDATINKKKNVIK